MTMPLNDALRQIPTGGFEGVSFMSHWNYNIMGFLDRSGLPVPVAELIHSATTVNCIWERKC
jgi:hypothetical protein